ncbi:MAG: hypothetical protein HQL76_13545 [Magnetococcales bacterium]|nr:hypothetical protein [Magnetococcales bacterium]
MATSIDAVAGDTMQAMLTAYRKSPDVTGAARQTQVTEMERTETSDERAVRKGENDAAVVVNISPEARAEYENSAAANSSGNPTGDPKTQS